MECSQSPNQGSQTPHLLWLSFIFVSGATLVGMVAYGLFRGLTFGWMAKAVAVGALTWFAVGFIIWLWGKVSRPRLNDTSPMEKINSESHD